MSVFTRRGTYRSARLDHRLGKQRTISDSNHEERFLKLIGSSGTKQEGLKDPLVHRSAEGSQSCASATPTAGGWSITHR